MTETQCDECFYFRENETRCVKGYIIFDTPNCVDFESTTQQKPLPEPTVETKPKKLVLPPVLVPTESIEVEEPPNELSGLPEEEITPSHIEYVEETESGTQTEEKPKQEPVKTILDKIIKPLEEITSCFDYITDFIHKSRDTPLPFIYAGAFDLYSSIFGRFFYFPDISGLNINQERLNTYIVICGLPGITRKGYLYAYYDKVYEEVMKYHLLTLGLCREHDAQDDIEEEENEEETEEEEKPKKKVKRKPIVDYLYEQITSNEGSEEGIADQIGKLKKLGVPFIRITTTEAGGFFLKMSEHGGYESGVPILLSKLYSGEGHTVRLSQKKGFHDRIIPKGTFTTFFGLMQNPEDYITPDNIKQGIMRRILIVKALSKKDDYKRLFDHKRREEIGKLDPLIAEMKKKLDTIFGHYNGIYDFLLPAIPVVLDPIVEEKINTIDQDKYNQTIDTKGDLKSQYEQSHAHHLVKLSAFIAIDENNIHLGYQGLEKCPCLYVSEEHYNKAKKFYDMVMAETESWVLELGGEKKQKKNIEEILNGIKHQIRRFAEKDYGIPEVVGYAWHSDIMKATHMSAAELNEHIFNLKEREEVEEKVVLAPTGRERRFYRVL